MIARLVVGVLLILTGAGFMQSFSVDVTVGGATDITPGSGSISALGHIWTFADVQDHWTGFNILKDGKSTGLHGTRLTWDGGAVLTRTYHHPYPFDPATGLPWTPPTYTAVVDANAPTNPQ